MFWVGAYDFGVDIRKLFMCFDVWCLFWFGVWCLGVSFWLGSSVFQDFWVFRLFSDGGVFCLYLLFSGYFGVLMHFVCLCVFWCLAFVLFRFVDFGFCFWV